MAFSPSLPSIPRLRVTRHSQLSPLDDDLSRTPTAGPSRLHVLQDESEDMDATPRLTVSSSLPSVYAVTEDTPAARLRALLAQIANLTSSHPRDGPTHRQTRASARESLRSLFTHALRDPGDTPRKGVRRNSIDLSEVEDTPRSGRVMEERARNKGKRMSLSDEELDKSSQRKTPTSTSHAADMQALRNHIMTSHVSQLSESTSAVSDASTDNTTSLPDAHAPGPGIISLIKIPRCNALWVQLIALMAHRPTKGNSVASGSLPPAPQMTVSSIAARPRSSLIRAGSLTETKLSANALRRSGGPRTRKDSYDSISSVDSVAGNVSSARNTPERRDSYHHHRASHSLTGSPLPEEFPRQRHEPTYSGSSTSPSLAGSSSSIADSRPDYFSVKSETA
ncbi:hypothetical protein F5888DRAFT_1632097 [Russula emetica]|nr:hypothetical protein F5888DRAFT_1632097 [Russula emetica]